MNPRRTSRRADGFSLVEVMVAVVIICVGLLGIAKMQALSLSSTSTSRQRALAAMQAASIASAMHSNREYWAGDFQLTGVNPSFSLSGTGTVTSTTDAATATQAQNWLTANNMTFCLGAVGTTAKCDDKQLAAFDLARWWRNGVVPILPGATATIACNSPPVGNPAPISCTVVIGWNERAVALNTQSALAGQTFETPTYTLYVEP